MLIDATLLHDFVAHSRNKIVRENCRCDIGLRYEKVMTRQVHSTDVLSVAVDTCSMTI